MKKETAETLYNSLVEHNPSFFLAREKFIDFLVKLEVPDSSRFYEPAHVSHAVYGSDTEHTFSITRILRNANAQQIQLSLPKKIAEAAVNLVGGYSSDVLTRSIRQDSELVKFMQESKSPFSVLGKLETATFFGDGEEISSRYPILAIPGFEKADPVSMWESANASSSEHGVLSRIKAKYLKAFQNL